MSVDGAVTLGVLACGLAAAAAAASWVLTGRVLRWVIARRVLAQPEARSSHTAPTPVGGGLAVIAVIIAAGGGLAAFFGREDMAVLMIATLGLMLVGWRDDRQGLTPLSRLLAQAAAVATGLAVMDPAALAFQGLLPSWLDRAVLFLGWLWFVNLYNFIDGIDGITGSLTAMTGLGIVLIAAGSGVDPLVPLAAASIGGAALGFLAWNWHPARIFLGDVGSVPLGYVIGGLLILLAGSGAWAAALILPGYSLGDATVTLLRRLLRGEKVWQPHREHFYQRATQRGLSHAAVVRRVLAVKVVLVCLAAGTLAVPTAGQIGLVGLAAGLVLAALGWLAPFRTGTN